MPARARSKPAWPPARPAGLFGELDDIRAEAEAAGGYQLLPEEGTNPSVWYLPFKVNE